VVDGLFLCTRRSPRRRSFDGLGVGLAASKGRPRDHGLPGGKIEPSSPITRTVFVQPPLLISSQKMITIQNPESSNHQPASPTSDRGLRTAWLAKAPPFGAAAALARQSAPFGAAAALACQSAPFRRGGGWTVDCGLWTGPVLKPAKAY
jgi:hypothetical protein